MTFPTNPIYKLIKNPETNEATMALRWDNQCFVIKGKHRFAKEYLEWVAAGNTPEAAD